MLSTKRVGGQLLYADANILVLKSPRGEQVAEPNEGSCSLDDL
jgi:hypothetical protein